MCRRNWFYYDLRVCTELQVLSKTASRLWFYAYKKYKNDTSARRTSTQRHFRPAICSAEVTISVREYQEKLQKSNFKRHFLENGWSHRCEILQDNLEDQAQRHISKLCSFY